MHHACLKKANEKRQRHHRHPKSGVEDRQANMPA